MPYLFFAMRENNSAKESLKSFLKLGVAWTMATLIEGNFFSRDRIFFKSAFVCDSEGILIESCAFAKSGIGLAAFPPSMTPTLHVACQCIVPPQGSWGKS